MPEMVGAICGGGPELVRVEDGAVAWCFRCREHRAHSWVVTEAFDGYVVSGFYRCDRCDSTAVDFFGEPRFNLEPMTRQADQQPKRGGGQHG